MRGCVRINRLYELVKGRYAHSTLQDVKMSLSRRLVIDKKLIVNQPGLPRLTQLSRLLYDLEAAQQSSHAHSEPQDVKVKVSPPFSLKAFTSGPRSRSSLKISSCPFWAAKCEAACCPTTFCPLCLNGDMCPDRDICFYRLRQRC
jgi:hypothetical protein